MSAPSELRCARTDVNAVSISELDALVRRLIIVIVAQTAQIH